MLALWSTKKRLSNISKTSNNKYVVVIIIIIIIIIIHSYLVF